MQIVYTAANRCPHFIGSSAIPDLNRIDLLVPADTITALTGIHWTWGVTHRAGGALLIASIFTLLIAPDYRKRVFALGRGLAYDDSIVIGSAVVGWRGTVLGFPRDINRSVADISKAQKHLNDSQCVSLREALERTIEWWPLDTAP